MTTVTFTEFRNNLKQYFDKTEDDFEEIIVTRGKGRSAVVVDLNEFLALQETAYLLSTKENRKHLEKSLAEAVSGNIVPFKLSR